MWLWEKERGHTLRLWCQQRSWWLAEPVGFRRNHRRLRCLRLTGRGLPVCGHSLGHPEQKSCVFFSLLLHCSTPVLTPQRLWAQTSTSPGSQWKCMTFAGTSRSSWWDPMGSLSCAGPTLLLSALSRLISWRTWNSSKPCRKAMLLSSLLESCSEKKKICLLNTLYLNGLCLPKSPLNCLSPKLPCTKWIYAWEVAGIFSL